MPGGPYEWRLDDLPIRWVEKARMALALSVGDQAVVVYDVDADEFVRLPWQHPGRDDSWRWFGLSPDGRHLVAAGRQTPGLYWYELASGQTKVLDRDVRHLEEDTHAAVSPDGQSIATLSLLPDPDDPDGSGAGLGSLNVVDIASGTRRSVWQRRNTSFGGVAWSPDQQMFAVAYTYPDDDDFGNEALASAVVDAAGTIVSDYPGLWISPPNNGAWLDDHHLLGTSVDPYEYGSYGLVALNVHTNDQRTTGASTNAIVRIGNRLVFRPEQRGIGPIRLETANIDGTDPQPFLTIHPHGGIDMLDHTPEATP